MRIATISHSHVALRQQLFFQEIAKQGHDVLMIAPGEWFDYKVRSYKQDTFELVTCRHIGDNIYSYKLLGAKEIIESFKPDWLYVQAEPGSLTADEALDWKVDKRALFTWENISIKGNGKLQLPRYDLVVCGNPEAESLVKPHNPHTVLMLQVGVDTDHFQARPRVPRDVEVAYIGRPAPEKGISYLMSAWPMVKILGWKDFLELPWPYSQIKVVVAYSQDTPEWKEQAPNYVLLEAMSTGCKGIASDTASMVYWLKDAPGIIHVPQGKVIELKEGIQRALTLPNNVQEENREYVISKFSNPVMAKKLLEVLDA